MLTLPEGLLSAAILGLIGWIYKQSSRMNIIETKLELMDSTIESKIDKKVSESTAEFKELVHELKLTLTELNATVKYLSKEVERRTK